jgi:hypothetical protein
MLNWNMKINLGKEDYVEACSKGEKGVICGGWGWGGGGGMVAVWGFKQILKNN